MILVWGLNTIFVLIIFLLIIILNMSQFLLYIDPGSGSLLFQALLSGLLTALVFYKRIVAYFKYKFGKKNTEEIDNLD
jgi:hypothetical protein